ncbi:MAG: YabP/YqfC family sporulation protein [Firmicutes bacterium]|nr:YabP/YqfC family sporulation protein [Bacillota bacterium]
MSEYTAEHIKIKTSAGNISIFGNMLTIKMISADNIEIKGKVDKLEVMK